LAGKLPDSSFGRDSLRDILTCAEQPGELALLIIFAFDIELDIDREPDIGRLLASRAEPKCYLCWPAHA